MKYSVAIRNNATGEVRTHQMEVEWWDHSLFWWTDGNMGCDCNRQWEFERAGGEKITEDPDPPCGDTRFTVLHATLEDGSVVEIDEAE